MQNENLISLTADIVAAHVANNKVAVGEVGSLVEKVHTALAQLATERAIAEPQPRRPFVSVRASVKPEFIVCMACGKKQKMLKRHLRVDHDLTPGQYREAYGLPEGYPLVAPDFARLRRELARKIGFGSKPKRSKSSRSDTGPAEPSAL